MRGPASGDVPVHPVVGQVAVLLRLQFPALVVALAPGAALVLDELRSKNILVEVVLDASLQRECPADVLTRDKQSPALVHHVLCSSACMEASVRWPRPAQRSPGTGLAQ